MSIKNGAVDASPVQMYSRLLNLASDSLAKVSENVRNYICYLFESLIIFFSICITRMNSNPIHQTSGRKDLQSHHSGSLVQIITKQLWH